MGLELILPAVGIQLPSPIQKGNLGELWFYGSSRYGSRSTAVSVGILCKGRGTGQPDACLSFNWTEVRPAVWQTRGRPSRSPLTATLPLLALSLRKRRCIRQNEERQHQACERNDGTKSHVIPFYVEAAPAFDHDRGNYGVSASLDPAPSF